MTTANESARPGTRPTERELQVLRAWRDTGNATAAAEYLGIRVGGVRAALANVRSRADVESTAEAAERYLEPDERSSTALTNRVPVHAGG